LPKFPTLSMPRNVFKEHLDVFFELHNKNGRPRNTYFQLGNVSLGVPNVFPTSQRFSQSSQRSPCLAKLSRNISTFFRTSQQQWETSNRLLPTSQRFSRSSQRFPHLTTLSRNLTMLSPNLTTKPGNLETLSLHLSTFLP